MHPTPEELAKAIARDDPHAFDKHVIDQREFSGGEPRYGSDTGVRTPQDFEAHILKVLKDRGTKGFESEGGHFHLYHKESNTYVFHDTTGRYRSTAYRPTHPDYFGNLLRDDCDQRQDWFRGRVSEKGGYRALLENLGRATPERAAEPPQRKNAFELARERALAAETKPPRQRGKDSDRER